MRKAVILLILVAFLGIGVSTVSAFTVFDPINHATSLLRNAILQAQQVEDLLEAGKRLLELKNLLKEFQFFNQKLIEAGFGEIESVIQKFRSLFGDSGNILLPFEEDTSKTYLQTVQQNPFFQGTASQIAQIEFASAGAESWATTLPYYLTLVPDPLSPNHQYITYEQSQIARTFDESEALRKYAEELAKDGVDLEEAAAQANLLGATRLQAASMGKLYEAFGVLLSAQGRLAELNAIALEQTSRDEKLDELARRKMFQDMDEFVHGNRATVIDGVRL
ncbi:MAG: hypothetical protein A2Z83_09145 [Omnitrophica bacterium GWA2_52_8]|nr:MAG: hypothetical protein A2Z83_09145 [Omnitrophica bacterium GWA2_52_8]